MTANGETLNAAYITVNFLMVVVINTGNGNSSRAIKQECTLNGGTQHTPAIHVVIGLDIYHRTGRDTDVAQTLNKVCLVQYLIVMNS